MVRRDEKMMAGRKEKKKKKKKRKRKRKRKRTARRKREVEREKTAATCRQRWCSPVSVLRAVTAQDRTTTVMDRALYSN
jgi:hypothetical protein